jgi:phthalate 4,5-dioxygenase oxygenase subunit
MLRKADNELLCRVGPGTPMGELMRQYWLPAARSDEVVADGRPLRVRLLGESLVMFRDSSGRVGLMHHLCPHRRASLFYGRNEEDGLRCIYHGWKFDVEGRCVDMPSEPPESDFKRKIRARAYPCVERGGVVWTYMGPHEEPPPLPDLEGNMDPESRVWTMIRDCNWMQALEGDIDTAHFGFLHVGHLKPEDAADDHNFMAYMLRDRSPRYATIDTEYGTCYGAYRPAMEGRRYWRIGHFMFPFYTLIPSGAIVINRRVRAWVPMDDEHTLFFQMTAPEGAHKYGWGEEVADQSRRPPRGAREFLPDTGDWYGRSRPLASLANDHLRDYDLQRSGRSFTGLPSVALEDQAVTESMGPLLDRDEEHLGSSDAMVIRTRRRLINAAKAFRDKGVVPPGVNEPAVYGQRGGGLFLPEDADWWESTKELRRAFVEHSEELMLETVGQAPTGRP